MQTMADRDGLIWLDGEMVDWREAKIHVLTHTLHYGMGVFEGLRAYEADKGTAIFRLKAHTDRLFESARIMNMTIPFDKDTLNQAQLAAVRENNLKSAYIRPMCFYGSEGMGLRADNLKVHVMVAAWEWGAYLGEACERGANANIVPWRRIHHSQFDQRAKLGGLYCLSTISGVLSRQKGYDEAIFLNLEGNVAEGPGENIMIIKNGVMITNDTSESILEGITRTSILEMAKDMGMECRIGPITKEDFFQADEAFFTGTAAEVAPIVRVTDDSDPERPGQEYTIGSGQAGEITKKIRTLYLEIVKGKHQAYNKWLTYVNE